MEVGEYVRTKNGEIGKLVNVEIYYVLGQDDKDKFSCVLFNNNYVPCIVSNDFIIKKGKIIDLIEVGDYVNGRYVDKYQGKLGNFCELPNGKWKFIEIPNEHYLISSIVTKEQFSQMEYRIGE